MNREEKIKFITELTDSVKDDLLSKVDRMPDSWDGVELRWAVRDKFSGVVLGSYDNKKTKRYKDYQNIVICDNIV